MHTELLPSLVNTTIKPTDEQDFIALLNQLRTIYPKTPAMLDDTYKALDKMGPVKRTEFDAKIAILKKNKPPLAASLSIDAAENKVAISDAAKKAALTLIEAASDLMRLAIIAGAEGYNMLKCCEEDNDIVASRDKAEASISTRNEINAIDKKKLAALASDKAKIETLANKKAEERISKVLENK